MVGAPRGTVYKNYTDRNVEYEIPSLSDAVRDRNWEECFEDVNIVKLWRDNHCGYIGFREPLTESLIDDGAMNVVVRYCAKP